MKKRIGIIVITLLLLGGVGALGYLYYDAKQEVSDLRAKVTESEQKLQDFKTNPELAAQEEVAAYVEEVGKLYALPANEEPSVATVNDKSKLTDQPFFSNAENGDITLIYAQSKLAILYRPSTKQLVNVSSVTINNDNSADQTNN